GVGKTVRGGSRMSEDVRRPQGNFTGEVAQRPLHELSQPAPVRVSFVRFQPGARTHWHAHTGGQVLQVLEGEAETQEWEEPVQRLKAGDSVVAAPGRKHWHGAGPGGPMTHLAVTIGELEWFGPVES
ncbi:MAG TPA: cupin domain-containing protein, partial [Candidatus Acidoferrales bacterium]|nr:cupin domain-containing protein [Candidatus Acidoferrales bacterium]